MFFMLLQNDSFLVLRMATRRTAQTTTTEDSRLVCQASSVCTLLKQPTATLRAQAKKRRTMLQALQNR
jgi:hypothetical protein